MTWRAKNLCQSTLPLTTAFAIVGLGVFRYPCGRLCPKFSIVYAIITTMLYCVALGFGANFVINSTVYGETEKVALSIVYANAGIAGASQILIWYHKRMCFRLGEAMSKIDETLQQLGATFDYKQCFQFGIVVIVAWLILMAIFNAVDALWFIGRMPFGQILILASILHHPFHVNYMVTFHFFAVVRLIRIRFGKANEVLENLTSPSQQRAAFDAWEHSDTKLSPPTLRCSTHGISNDDRNRMNVIRTIKQVHLELNAAANDLNRAYGVQMALQIAADFILLTGNLYNVYNLLTNPSLTERNFQLLVLFVWSSTHFVKLILINQVCEHLNNEAQRTGSIIHAIQGSIRDPELSDEIHQFSLQMIQDPVFLSPVGFFTLGFPFVLGFLGTVTTYLVILIDMSAISTHRQRH